MPLISLRDVSVRFRGPPLLDGVSCYIEAGQRIGLLGRNGAGKTTLMRLVSGQIQPDAGEVIAAPGTTVALLRQDVPQDMAGPIRDVVAAGLPLEAGANAGDGAEHDTAWQREHAVDQILSRMSLVGEVLFETLSSGMKRRVLLARARVNARMHSSVGAYGTSPSRWMTGGSATTATGMVERSDMVRPAE